MIKKLALQFATCLAWWCARLEVIVQCSCSARGSSGGGGGVVPLFCETMELLMASSTSTKSSVWYCRCGCQVGSDGSRCRVSAELGGRWRRVGKW